MSDINELRNEMDAVTLEMINLLKTRTDIAKQIGEVKKITKLGTTTIYNKMKEGTFPKSYKVGNRTYWLKSDIIEWINSR